MSAGARLTEIAQVTRSRYFLSFIVKFISLCQDYFTFFEIGYLATLEVACMWLACPYWDCEVFVRILSYYPYLPIDVKQKSHLVRVILNQYRSQ